MPNQSRTNKPDGDKKSGIQNKPQPASPEQANEPSPLTGLPGGLLGAAGDPSIEAQATRLNNTRFQTAQRQAMAVQLGRVGGNQHFQRVLQQPTTDSLNQAADSLQLKASEQARTKQISATQKNSTQAQSTTIIQRNIFEDAWNWLRSLFRDDPETLMRNLDTGLDRAIQALRAGRPFVRDPGRLNSVIRHLEGLKRHTGRIGGLLDAQEKIEKVEAFVDALDDIPDNIADDPEQAADAFGRLFAAAGDLGQELPTGPWTAYFRWLSGARNFFTDVLRGLRPSTERPSARRELREAERSWTTDQRGLHRKIDSR